MPKLSLIGIILISLLQLGCSNMFFIPMQQHVRTPTEIGLKYSDIEFESSDGTPLHGWFLPAQSKPRGSILFLHGNAENISTHIGSVYWLPEAGYNVLLFDYRGYGKSGGAAELHGVIRDAEAAIKQMVEINKTSDLPVIVYGQSIGAAISTYAVAHSHYKDQIDALIVESGFSSYRQIAREKLAAFWLTWPLQYPLSWTVSDAYKPIDAIPLIAPIPLLLVYSEEDFIIPPHHGQQLYDTAEQPKQLWLVPNGRHISVFARPEQRKRLRDYLDSINTQ